MERKTFDTGKGTIVYWVGGPQTEGPALVLLPGLTADHGLFGKQIEHFEPRVRCLTWDAPSHAESRPFPLCWTLDDLARWVNDILEVEGIEQPLLVGQSLGGYISQAFMDLFPGKAAGFVSIDSAPLQKRYYPAWEVWLLRHTKTMYRSIPWNILKPWGVRGTTESAYGRSYMNSVYESYSKREFCDLAAWGYRALADAVDANRPYEINCPALLICGTKDQAGDVKVFNRKWTETSGIPLHWIEGAGHNSNMDCPDEINDLIGNLLA